jgi:type IV pilus assembly protein PilW
MDRYSKLKAVAKHESGFTLVDMLIGLAMASVILVAIISLFVTLGRSYTTQNVAAQVQQVTRAGIELMVQDIRMAGVNPLKTSGVGVVNASASTIQISSDLNLNGVIDETYEQITYYLNGNRLMQQLFAGPPQPLVNNVTNLSFVYLDENNNPTAILTDIRMVEISMRVEEQAGRGETVSRTYATRVRCRNLGL